MTLADRILYIDADLVAIDKPAGLPVDTPRRGGDSVEARLYQLCDNYRQLPAIMHRLDQDTSGCLLLARHQPARRWVQQAFEAHTVAKEYVALLGGPVEGEGGVIDLPLAKVSSAEAGWRMVADASGKPATTRWTRIAALKDGRTLVRFVPETGRTHQIRVHAREGLGEGIVGDPVYGYPTGGPMMLHAERLSLEKRKGGRLELHAPLPDHFAEVAHHVA